MSNIPDQIFKGLKKSTIPLYERGGQSCGNIPIKVRLEHEVLGFAVEVWNERSQIRNLESCMEQFEWFLVSKKII